MPKNPKIFGLKGYARERILSYLANLPEMIVNGKFNNNRREVTGHHHDMAGSSPSFPWALP